MRRLVSGNMWQRLCAAAIGLFVISAVSAPVSAPARGDGALSIAVQAFENEAGAPSNVVNDMSASLYQGVASSGKFAVKGGGPLHYGSTLTSDPFMEGLSDGAKTGAEDLLVGSIVQLTGGQVYYRLALYRIAPVTFIRSQVFSQAYPPGDAHALSAGFSANVSTLSAPRQAVGTVYSTSEGVKADLGTSEGFVLGDRFNVMRLGQKVAEATITSIRDDDATLTISNASSGYAPKVGDRLIGLRALPPVEPAPPTRSSFNPLGFLAAVGATLLAVGHHGQPGSPGITTGSPLPSSSPFTVAGLPFADTPPNINFVFIFSNLLSNTSQLSIPGSLTYASFSILQPGAQATTQPQILQSLGNVTFATVNGPLGQPESQMTVAAMNLVAGQTIFITLTSTINDQNSNPLVPTIFTSNPLSIIRHPMSTLRPVGARPIPPVPTVPVGPKPGTPPKVPPENPKPGPGNPHPPH